MGTAALFPTSLYTTDATIEDNTLTLPEWQQITVEVEALEATIGSSAQASAGTIQARIASLASGMGLSATGHGALSSTAATHPFSALTGTFTATQHGALGTDATHPYSALTGAPSFAFTSLTGTLGTAQTSTAAASVYSFGGLAANSLQATANPSLTMFPVANSAIATLAALDVRGNATSTTSTRTFLGHFGLTVTAANSAGGDRVALYAGVNHSASAGGAWSINSVVSMNSASSTADSYFGWELDFNNMATHAGDATGIFGLVDAPFMYGMAITGASLYRSIAAILISGPQSSSQIQWNRGIVIPTNVIAQATLQDLGSADVSLDLRGNNNHSIRVGSDMTGTNAFLMAGHPTYALHVDGSPAWGLYVGPTSPDCNNYIAGNLGIGHAQYSSAGSGSSAGTNMLVMGMGGAPTAAPAAGITLYGEATSSGANGFALMTGQVAATASSSTAAMKYKVRLEGVEYYLMLQTA